MSHLAEDLIDVFNQTFTDMNTRLVKGDDEPLYVPAEGLGTPAQIIFAHGFFASALHEIAHWCIAGEKRRQLVDYGYWYQPDGRSAQRQKEFEQVEVAPQAIEWAFSLACGFRFHVSVDNLGGDGGDWRAFQRKIAKRLAQYLEDGFPQRAATFISALQAHFQPPYSLQQGFERDCLREFDALIDAH